MAELCAVISCLLLTVGVVTAQTAQVQVGERLLPQWLTGIIALVAFLFITFVVFLVKKAWCEESSRRRTSEEAAGGNQTANDNLYDTSLDLVRSSDDANAYDNVGFDGADAKVTSM